MFRFKLEYILYFLFGSICAIIGISQLSTNNISTSLFYLINFILSLSCIILSYISKNGRNLYWIGFILFSLVLSCRDQMGIDDHVYKNIFDNAYKLNLSQYFTTSGTEKGYLTLNWILYHLTNGNYAIAQFLISTFSVLTWAVAIKKTGGDVVSSSIMLLFLWTHYYFFVLSAGLVRIFIAIPIILYSLNFIWKKNTSKFLFCVFIASLFHISSMMMLILLPFTIWDKFFFKHWVLYILIISIVVVGAFMFVASYLVPILGDRYEGYGNTGTLSIGLSSLDVLPILVISLVYHNRIKALSDIEHKRYTIGIILLSLSIVFSVAATLVPLGRLIFYANLGILITMSSIFKLRSISIKDLFIKSTIIVYALFYMFYTLWTNPLQNETLFPYISFIGVY